MKQPKANIELQPSRISGVGVYAIRNIKKGMIIGNSEEKFIKSTFYHFYSWKDYQKFDTSLKKKVRDFCIGQLNGFFAPIDFDIVPTTWYINHCYDGNMGFNRKGDFIAIKNIRKGEELCFDYGVAESNPKFRLLCKCGKKQCRRIITGNDWKNPEFSQKNFNIMYPGLRKLIQQLAKKHKK